MGPRSAGFEDLEAGFPHPQDEEEHEPSYNDEEEEDEDDLKPSADADEDELAVAEREYLNEMRTGMHIAEEDGITI